MTPDEIRAVLLEMPDAVEGSHQGHPDFRVGKSIFATLWPEKGRSVLRLPLPLAESLEQEKPERYKVISRSGGAGWLGVQISDADPEEFRSLAEVAWHSLKGSSTNKA